MKALFLLSGALALGIAAPAFAGPGHGRGHGHGIEAPLGYGMGGCPPGLAKKAVPCMPPGQAKKMYGVGQRLPLGVANRYGYSQIPYSLRNQYALNPSSSYYYGNGYLYRVDPRTMLVQQVISALLR
jgi:hypothetical protein